MYIYRVLIYIYIYIYSYIYIYIHSYDINIVIYSYNIYTVIIYIYSYNIYSYNIYSYNIYSYNIYSYNIYIVIIYIVIIYIVIIYIIYIVIIYTIQHIYIYIISFDIYCYLYIYIYCYIYIYIVMYTYIYTCIHIIHMPRWLTVALKSNFRPTLEFQRPKREETRALSGSLDHLHVTGFSFVAEIFIRFAKMVPRTAENVATVWPFECNCLYFGRPKQMSAIFAENHCSGASNELRFHPPMNPISPRGSAFFFFNLLGRVFVGSI